MITRWLLMALAMGFGALLSVQVALNAMVKAHAGHALWATLANFTVGAALIVILILAQGLSLPSLAALGAVPWWAWLAGGLGAGYVAVSTIAAPVLGGALLVALVVCGQTLAALTIDHHGWLGFPVRPADPLRLLGAALVVTGVVLLARR